MTDNEKVQFHKEGEPAFPVDTETDNSADSPSEETKTDTTDDSSDGGDKKPDADKDKNVPFDQHPAWKEREKKWDDRFNDQETRHQNDLKAIREEFGTARKDNANQTKIPSWFGGSQEQWDAYRADRDLELKEAEERAYKRVSETKTQEDKAIADATDYLKSEVTAIESDKTLNPTGAKIDVNKLVKIVMDNDLVTSKGQWNYRAGFALLQNQNGKSKPGGNRKDLAGASSTDNTSETKPSQFKTSADFKKPGARPW